ncbi:MAG: hypothetical protein OQJ95_06465 [Kangiella sp.]|nr:hypothetical protein [Kangiella sp.]
MGRTEVSYFQVSKSNTAPKRKVYLVSFNNKEIMDDTVAFEILPGSHEITYYCVGRDGEKYHGSQTITTKPNYFYELTARSNGTGECFHLFQMYGKVVTYDDKKQKIPVNHPKGEPLPSSASFHSIFERYEKDYPNQIWPEITNGMYNFLTRNYSCEHYKITSVNSIGSGRVWKEEQASELSITGDLGEQWKIVACGEEYTLYILLEKPGNSGKYISIYRP